MWMLYHVVRDNRMCKQWNPVRPQRMRNLSPQSAETDIKAVTTQTGRYTGMIYYARKEKVSSTKCHFDILFLYIQCIKVQGGHSFTTSQTVHPLIKCSMRDEHSGVMRLWVLQMLPVPMDSPLAFGLIMKLMTVTSVWLNLCPAAWGLRCTGCN